MGVAGQARDGLAGGTPLLVMVSGRLYFLPMLTTICRDHRYMQGVFPFNLGLGSAGRWRSGTIGAHCLSCHLHELAGSGHHLLRLLQGTRRGLPCPLGGTGYLGYPGADRGQIATERT